MKQSEELDQLFYKLAYHDLKRIYHVSKWHDYLEEAMGKFKQEYSDLPKGDILETFKALEKAKREEIKEGLFLGEN